MTTAGADPDRRAVRALAVTFGVNGVLFPSLLPRYPQVIEMTGATPSTFGLALVGAGVGGILAGPLVPVLARRVGLVRLVTASGLLLAVAVTGVAAATSVLLLGLAFVAAGALDAVHDVSMNEVALGEQSRRRRSVLGRLHGLWSLGATAGTGVGALAAGLGVPVVLHVAGVAVLGAAAQGVAARHLRSRPAPEDRAAAIAPHAALPPSRVRRIARVRRAGALTLLVVAAVAAIVAEATPLDWAALMLREDRGAGPGIAGAGPLCAAAGVLLGRLLVDRVLDRVGATAVVRSGNMLAASAVTVGLVLSASTDRVWPVLIGLLLAGIGVSANFPVLFGAADAVAARLGLPPGSGSSIVGTLPRLGGLVLPAVVGLVAEGIGLTWAVGITALAATVVAVALPVSADGPGGR